MKNLIKLLLVSIFINVNQVHAQEGIEKFIEQRLETILENSEEAVEASEIFEKLIELTQNPVSLNGSDIITLLELQLINHRQYLSLLNYKKAVGKIQNIQELRFLDHFNKKTFTTLKPFIRAGDLKPERPKLAELFKYSQHHVFIRFNQILQSKKGYKNVGASEFLANPNKYYLGSPGKIYTRYKMITKDHFKAALIFEKDPGEALIKSKYPESKNLVNHPIPKIDFYSFHVSASNWGLVKRIVLGDYHLQFGQGLTLWSNFAFNKSSEVTSVKRYAGDIIPSTSSIENNFFRGMATTLKKGNFNFSVFYSDKNRDANIYQEDNNGKVISFTSIQNTGLHRTINELKDRNTINEKFVGKRFSFKSNKLQLGTTWYQSKWNAQLLPSEQLYKTEAFSGTINTCIGFDYQYLLKNALLYGEFSMSRNNGKAYLTGLDFQIDAFSKFSFLWRNYENGYQNFYANPFAESLAKNEKGLYLGFDNSFLPKWKIQLYLDLFQFPWLKSSADAPSDGMDYFVQINHKASEKLHFYFRFKKKIKQLSTRQERWFSDLVQESKQSFRLNLIYKPVINICLKSRVEWINYKKGENPRSLGMLIYQQVEYDLQNKPMKLYFRYTNFNTDNFDSRIYTYENDVLYAFSVPAFYDIGNHFFFLLNYELSKSLKIWFKLRHTHFNNKESIGSGNEEINGSNKTEIKFQLRVKI